MNLNLNLILWATLLGLLLNPLDSRADNLEINSQEINQVYSEDFAPLNNGYSMPISKSPILESYTWENAPQDLKTKFGNFKYLLDSKGYLHIGKAISFDQFDKLYSILTNLDTYIDISFNDGTPLFEQLKVVSTPIAVVRPKSGGVINGETKTQKALVKLDIDGTKLESEMEARVTVRDEGLVLELLNSSAIRYSLLGEILAPGDFYLKAEFSRFEKGWLFRGVSKFNTSSRVVASKIKDPKNLALGQLVFDWLGGRLVSPISSYEESLSSIQ